MRNVSFRIYDADKGTFKNKCLKNGMSMGFILKKLVTFYNDNNLVMQDGELVLLPKDAPATTPVKAGRPAKAPATALTLNEKDLPYYYEFKGGELPPGVEKNWYVLLKLWDTLHVDVQRAIRTMDDKFWYDQIDTHGEWLASRCVATPTTEVADA